MASAVNGEIYATPPGAELGVCAGAPRGGFVEGSRALRVMVVGQGYVGLTASTGLAAAGHDVVGVEQDPARHAALQQARCPVYEPGLQQLLAGVVNDGKLTFARQVRGCRGTFDVAIIAVASPPLPSGGADIRQVEAAVSEVLALDPPPAVIITKSTIPPGTSRALVARSPHSATLRQAYAHCPEFLNQGTAVIDWQFPSRVVVGLWNQALVALLRDLFRGVNGPWVVSHPTDAEVVKYASNAFLAVKISFANEVANYCDAVAAGIDVVVEGLQLDPRMAAAFWRPGLGYGDSCLPKDVAALIQHGASLGYPMRLLESVQAVNATQCLRPVGLAREWIRGHPQQVHPTVAVLGLVYEPHSDDMRAAPSIRIVPELQQLAQNVRVWDGVLPAPDVMTMFPGVTPAESPELAVCGADIVVVLTEFEQVTCLDWSAAAVTMGPEAVIIDGKNCLDADQIRAVGLAYRGVGRPAPQVADPGGEPTRDLVASQEDWQASAP
jgi:UDPglucose 6-dehydrogenase